MRKRNVMKAAAVVVIPFLLAACNDEPSKAKSMPQTQVNAVDNGEKVIEEKEISLFEKVTGVWALESDVSEDSLNIEILEDGSVLAFDQNDQEHSISVNIGTILLLEGGEEFLIEARPWLAIQEDYELQSDSIEEEFGVQLDCPIGEEFFRPFMKYRLVEEQLSAAGYDRMDGTEAGQLIFSRVETEEE